MTWRAARLIGAWNASLTPYETVYKVATVRHRSGGGSAGGRARLGPRIPLSHSRSFKDPAGFWPWRSPGQGDEMNRLVIAACLVFAGLGGLASHGVAGAATGG